MIATAPRHRRDTALSAARAGLAAIWCATVMAIALAVDHPFVLAALLLLLGVCGWAVGCTGTMLKALRFTLPLAITVALVNAFISRDGVTVVARLGDVPVLGRLDVTLEALVYGAVLGLRVIVVSLAAVLFTAVVDQDELIRIVRRRSGRFGLTAAVSGRLLPLLAADGSRMAEARRSLPDGVAASRLQLVSAVASGALERAADAAAALEMRGLGEGPCLAPRSRLRWSRHDVALAVSSAAAAALIAVALIAGWINFHSTARISAAWGAGLVATCLALPLILVLPLLERRGVRR